MIDGKKLVANKYYQMATTSFLAAGGDGYSMFKNLTPLNYENQMSRLLSDIVIDNMIEEQDITLANDSRLVNLSNKR